jgi:hypothetical protein
LDAVVIRPGFRFLIFSDSFQTAVSNMTVEHQAAFRQFYQIDGNAERTAQPARGFTGIPPFFIVHVVPELSRRMSDNKDMA